MKGDQPNYFGILHASTVLYWSIHLICSVYTNLFCYARFCSVCASQVLCSKNQFCTSSYNHIKQESK